MNTKFNEIFFNRLNECEIINNQEVIDLFLSKTVEKELDVSYFQYAFNALEENELDVFSLKKIVIDEKEIYYIDNKEEVEFDIENYGYNLDNIDAHREVNTFCMKDIDKKLLNRLSNKDFGSYYSHKKPIYKGRDIDFETSIDLVTTDCYLIKKYIVCKFDQNKYFIKVSESKSLYKKTYSNYGTEGKDWA
ncbi:hypothetical protein [Poseidonibacter ostreae]|uniref:Uncharacterized protein n=1 Tax=Poseidonibacter ostreae TaxID=2654171 RepID=A0A6L4WT03_9BACT|nr:hypothetical protein [Poseidonibacter ostreae]KAB7884991.1 hypothetical protein GA417_09700 [Poseidonibacter ostreae]KAB7888983.1 hypothetical protein GBG19_07280 [Poseidonibacter ostreae]KAB7891916.1 hypothetical protein GBG18_04830 [Poseidonibacter ostreae]